MKTLATIAAIVLLTRCASYTYRAADGTEISANRVGWNTSIGTLEAEAKPDGKRLHVEGYQSNSEQAVIEALLDALRSR